MTAYLVRRLLLAVPTLIGITVVTFALSRLAPGGPVAQRIATLQAHGQTMTEAEIRHTQELLGLDQPLLAQYGTWLWRAARLDFGRSFAADRLLVRDKLWRAFRVSVVLQVLAVLVIYLVAVPLGVWSALRHGTRRERVVTMALFVLYSIPNFFLAALLLLWFSSGRYFEFLPMLGLRSLTADELSWWGQLKDYVWHLLLPVICLAYAGLAAMTRYTRSGMLEVLRQDYVQAARARGLPESRVVGKHALRNGILPLITLLAHLFPFLLGGSVVVESIFGIPGMGRLTYEAVLDRDYPVVMAVSTFVGVATLVGFLVADVLYVWLDPRVKLT